MHAISRDAMVFPHTECLYLMIDAKLVDSVPGTPASTPGMIRHLNSGPLKISLSGFLRRTQEFVVLTLISYESL